MSVWNNAAHLAYLPVVQLALNVNLPFGDVACQVWNGMCDVIVGHGQDRQLCDGALAAFNPSCPLIDGGQVGVHVTCRQSPRCCRLHAQGLKHGLKQK